MQSPLLLCDFEYVPISETIRSMVPTHKPNEILIQTEECTFYVYNTTTREKTPLQLAISEYDSASVLVHADSKCIILITNYGSILKFTSTPHKNDIDATHNSRSRNSKGKRRTQGSDNSLWTKCTKFALPDYNFESISMHSKLEITDNHIFSINRYTKELRMFDRNTFTLHDKFQLPQGPIIGQFLNSQCIIVAGASSISKWSAINSKLLHNYVFPSEFPEFFKVICNNTYIVCFDSIIAETTSTLDGYVLTTEFKYINKFTINDCSVNKYNFGDVWFVTENHICIVNTHFSQNKMWCVNILDAETTSEYAKYNKPTITAYDSTQQLINIDCKFITNSCDQLIIRRYTTVKQLFVAMLCFYRLGLPNEIIHNIMLFLGIDTYAN